MLNEAEQEAALNTPEKRIERLCLELADRTRERDDARRYWNDEKRRYDAADKAFRQVCDERNSLSYKLSSESKRADDMMHRGDSWREMCDELEAKLKGQSLRLDSALGALTEIFQLADGISDDMTLPEIGTIALGAIQKPLVERRTLLDDGFGNQWKRCERADCGLEIVRPGKVQCGVCDAFNR